MSSSEIEMLGLFLLMALAILIFNGVALVVFVIGVIGLLDEKAEHFWPAIIVLIDLIITCSVNGWIFCNPEIYEIIRDLF